MFLKTLPANVLFQPGIDPAHRSFAQLAANLKMSLNAHRIQCCWKRRVMAFDCVECARLWGEYARTTVQHITLEGDVQSASLIHDRVRAAELQAVAERAAQRRLAARAAIADHENIFHRPEPQARAASAGDSSE